MAGRKRGGGLLVAGTTSDAGKSVVTAGICRWLAGQGVKVAPFKGQNMSLNSFGVELTLNACVFDALSESCNTLKLIQGPVFIACDL